MASPRCQAKIPSATSSGEFTYAASPLVSFGGLMYVMWPTGGNEVLKYAAFDGSWGSALTVPDSSVLNYGGPALTVMGSKMYATWGSQATSTIDWTSFTSAAWTKPKEVPHSQSVVNPGLAGYNGSLYDAWTPDIEGSPIDYSVHS